MAKAKDETTEEVTTEVTTETQEVDGAQESLEAAKDEAVNGRQLDEANDAVLGEGESVDPLEAARAEALANHDAEHAND